MPVQLWECGTTLLEKEEEQGYWNVAPSLFEISKIILNRNHIHNNENRRNFTKFNTASALEARCGYSITGANLSKSSLNPILFMNQNLSVPKFKPFITCHDPFNCTCPICSMWSIPGWVDYKSLQRHLLGYNP